MDSMESVHKAVLVDVWPWWVGGPLIGLYVIVFLLVKNRLLSASSTFQFVTDRVLRPLLGGKDTSRDWLTGSMALDDPEPNWLGLYFIGLFLGGVVSTLAAGTFAADPGLAGMAATYPVSLARQAGILAFSGLLIGFGTRMGGGCTSGHCIVGVSGLQKPSMISTGVFFGSGIVISFLVDWLGRGMA